MVDAGNQSGEAALPADEQELLCWLALARIEGLGCASAKKIAQHFASIGEAFAASEKQLREIAGLDQRAIHGLLAFSDWADANRELRRIKEMGAAILPITGTAYPERLRQIPDPPPFLYVRGGIRAQDQKAVAVVGSRSASPYGVRIARDLCRDLASLGFTVVSGMARGIDGEAHQAALEAGGRTVAVLGSGVDVIYPGEHRSLYHEISGSGAIISELSMGTRPLAHHFPARNRIISGLSLGVVVVEATEKSGSLITARLAMEQGREVFAVPGQAGASRSRGAHQLIREGAKLVENVDDIVEEIAPQLRSRDRTRGLSPKMELPAEMGVEAKKILELIESAPLQIDDLIEGSGLSPAKVSEVLLRLEIGGFLRQLPGKRFMAV
jgi:DNA processing protein